MKTDELSIRHNFTEREIGELARECSRSLSERGTLDSDLKAVKKDFESRIAGQDAKISSLSTRIGSGFEMRNVKHLVLDHRLNGYRLLVRMDNGHVSKRRKLEPDEMQMQLVTEEPKPYFATAALLVEDQNWPEDGCVVAIFEDEFEVLRQLPDVKIEPLPFLRIGEEA